MLSSPLSSAILSTILFSPELSYLIFSFLLSYLIFPYKFLLSYLIFSFSVSWAILSSILLSSLLLSPELSSPLFSFLLSYPIFSSPFSWVILSSVFFQKNSWDWRDPRSLKMLSLKYLSKHNWNFWRQSFFQFLVFISPLLRTFLVL